MDILGMEDSTMRFIVLWGFRLFVVTCYLYIGSFIIDFAKRGPSPFESGFRFVLSGFSIMLYFLSISMGVSIPTLFIRYLAAVNPFSLITVGLIFPAIAGSLSAWFILYNMKKNETAAGRVSIMFATFLLALFSHMFLVGFNNVKQMTPNIAFIGGVISYLGFKYFPDEHKS